MKRILNLKINSNKRYKKFIDEVVENEIVWGLKLKNQDGWAVAISNKYEDTEVMTFWSNKTYAKVCAKEDWSDYEACPIELENFLNDWLIGLNKDELLIGVNWDMNLIGLEVGPIDLRDEILKIKNN